MTGYYCPRKSADPSACPTGTYNPKQFGKSIETACLSCPAQSFQYKSAQPACYDCGDEAHQPSSGKDTCSCTYANRDFQVNILFMVLPTVTTSSSYLISVWLYVMKYLLFHSNILYFIFRNLIVLVFVCLATRQTVPLKIVVKMSTHCVKERVVHKMESVWQMLILKLYAKLGYVTMYTYLFIKYFIIIILFYDWKTLIV